MNIIAYNLCNIKDCMKTCACRIEITDLKVLNRTLNRNRNRNYMKQKNIAISDVLLTVIAPKRTSSFFPSDNEKEKLTKWREKQTTFALTLAIGVLRPNYAEEASKPTFGLRAVTIQHNNRQIIGRT